MKTVAELKSIFGMVKKQAILDEDGSVLVPERPVDLSTGYNFYIIDISTLEKDVDPMQAFWRQATLPPVMPGKEGAEPELGPQPDYVQGMMAVQDLEYVYVAARGNFTMGTKMEE